MKFLNLIFDVAITLFLLGLLGSVIYVTAVAALT